MKNTLLTSVLCAFVIGVSAQCPPASPLSTPYFDNFEGLGVPQFGTTFNNCWVGTNNSTSASFRWESEDATGANENSFNTGPFFDNTSFGTAGGNYVYLETSSGSAGDSAFFTSPQIDLSGSTNPVFSFAYHMFGATIGSLSAEVNDGFGWVSLFSVSGQQQSAGGDAYLTQSLSLAAYSGIIQVRFVGTRGTSFTGDIAIDDVLVGDPASCPTPTALSAFNVQPFQADVAFAAGSTSSNFEVEFGPDGFTLGSGTVISTTNDTLTITGLMASTAYDFYVRQICAPGDTSFSAGPGGFTTTIACPASTNLRDSNVTSTSATLLFDPGAGADFDVEFGAQGFTPGNGTVVNTTTGSVTISGLVPGTVYEFYVTDNCGGGLGSSVQVGPDVFATPPAAFSCSSGSPAQIFVDEFDGSTSFTGDIATTAGYDWNFATTGTPSSGTGPLAPASGSGYIFAETSSGSAGDSIQMTSPIIDLTGSLGEAQLSFFLHAFGSNIGILYVGVGTSPTGPFTNEYTFGPGQLQTAQGDPFIEQVVSLDAYAGQNIYIQFLYEKGSTGTSFQGDLSLDLVEVQSCMSSFCNPPNMTGVTNVMFDNADFFFDFNGGGSNGAIVEYGVSGFTPGTGAGTVVNTSNDTVNLVGLTATTTYDVYVQNDCGGAGLSTLVGPLTFTTPVSCPAPTALGDSAVTSTSATLFFDAGVSGTDFDVEFGLAGFTPGSGTVVNTTTNSVMLTGLMANSAYEFYVTKNCPGAQGSSVQVGPEGFFTLPQGVNCPTGTASFVYTEDFEAGYPFTTGTGDVAFTRDDLGTPSTGTGPVAADDGAFYIFAETSGNNNAVFSGITPAIDLTSASDAQLTFLLHAFGATIGTLNVNVGTSPTGPFTPTGYSSTGAVQANQADPFIAQAVNLASFVGQTVYIEFEYTSGTSFTGDLAIDLVQVEQCVGGGTPCNAPVGLGATNITDMTADLFFSPGMNVTSFDVEFGVQGFTPGTGTTINTTNDTVSISGLTAATTYDFYVTKNCATGGSATAGPASFGTNACSPSNACTHPVKLHDSFGDGYNGNILTVFQNGVAVGTLGDGFTNTVGNPPGDTLLTSIDLCDGLDAVIVLTTQGSFTGEIGLDVFAPFGGPLLASRDNQTGTALGDTLINIASISCGAPACPAPSGLGVTNVTTNSADVFFTPGGTGITFVEFGPAGFTPGSGTSVMTTNDTVTISGLTSAASFDVFAQDVCSGTDSSFRVGPESFTTAVCDTSSQCTFNVNLYDSFGDGFNGTTIDVFQGGVVVANLGANFTASSGSGGGGDSLLNQSLNLCDGIDAFFIINAPNPASNFPSEVGLEAFDPAGTSVLLDTNGGLTDGDTLGTFMVNCAAQPCPTVMFVNDSRSICDGDSTMIAGEFRTMAGTFSDTVLSADGHCDSIITTTTLTVNPTFVTPNMATICQGDSILAGGAFQTTSGVFTDTLSSANGCDSILVTTVNVLNVPSGATTMNICDGDSAFLGGAFQTMGGTFTDTLAGGAANGCDSLVVTTLTVDPAIVSNQTASICSGDSIQLGGGFQTAAGVYKDVFTSASGCDSCVFTTLTVNPNVARTRNRTICNGDSLFAGGMFQTMGGVFVDTFATSNGCDSIVTTNLTVSNIQVVQNPVSICAGDSVQLSDGSFTSMMGTFNDTTQSASGCDSVFSTIVTVLPNSAGSNFLTICDGDSVMAGGAFQTASGIFTDTVASANGCDSIVTTTVSVLPVSMVSVEDSICPGDSIFVGGAFQRMAGTFTDVFMGANGCDSTVTTIVKMRTDTACPGIGVPCPTATVNNTTVTICDGDSAMINGNFETMAGMFSDTIRSADGQCDSVINNTNLVVNPTTMGTVNRSICDGDSIIAGGGFQSMAGTFTDTVTGSNGCDSIITTNLTIIQTTSGTVMDSICPGDSLFVGGGFQTMAGMFTDTVTGSNGCDSVITTMLAVRDSSNALCDTTGGGNQGCLTVATDASWMQSTVMQQSNLSGNWNGVSSLPASSTFTDPVTPGQPYGFPSINEIGGTQVLQVNNNITFLRTTFNLSSTSNVEARLLTTVDDQADIYINGQRVVLITSFGRQNFKFPAHDIKFEGNGTVNNGFMGGDSYDVVTMSNIGSILQTGQNELIVAVRNLSKASDRGGLSFRMDINCGNQAVNPKSAPVASLDAPSIHIFPNPTSSKVNITTELAIEEVRVFDFSGKMIFSNVYDAEKTAQIDLANFANGIYFIEVAELGGETTVKKIVKE